MICICVINSVLGIVLYLATYLHLCVCPQQNNVVMTPVPEGDMFTWPADSSGAQSKTWTVLEGADLRTCQGLANHLSEALQVEVLPLLPDIDEDEKTLINPRLSRRKKKATRQVRMRGITTSLLHLLLQKLPQSSNASKDTTTVRTQLFDSVFKMFDANAEQVKPDQLDSIVSKPEAKQVSKSSNDIRMLCHKMVNSTIVPLGGLLCPDVSEMGYPLYLGCWIYFCDTVDDTFVLLGNRDPQHRSKAYGITQQKNHPEDEDHFFELIVSPKTQKLQVRPRRIQTFGKLLIFAHPVNVTFMY